MIWIALLALAYAVMVKVRSNRRAALLRAELAKIDVRRAHYRKALHTIAHGDPAQLAEAARYRSPSTAGQMAKIAKDAIEAPGRIV